MKRTTFASLEAILARRTRVEAPVAASWPASWGLEHLRLNAVTVTRPHREARRAHAAPVDAGWLHCPDCYGTGQAPGEGRTVAPCGRCHGLHQRIAQVKRAHLPASAIGCTLRGFDFDREGVPADLASQLRAVVDGGPGLLLYGPPGTGKTHIALGAVVELTAHLGRPAVFAHWPDHLAEIKATFDDRNASAEAVRGVLSGAPGLVVVDDLGAEYGTDFARGEVLRFVDARYREGRPLLVTTNLDPFAAPGGEDALVDAIGPRALSRLLAMCPPVYMGGVDARLGGVR